MLPPHSCRRQPKSHLLEWKQQSNNSSQNHMHREISVYTQWNYRSVYHFKISYQARTFNTTQIFSDLLTFLTLISNFLTVRVPNTIQNSWLMLLRIQILQSHKLLSLLLCQGTVCPIPTDSVDKWPPWQFLIAKPINFALTTDFAWSIQLWKKYFHWR